MNLTQVGSRPAPYVTPWLNRTQCSWHPHKNVLKSTLERERKKVSVCFKLIKENGNKKVINATAALDVLKCVCCIFLPIYSYRLVFPRVPEAWHSGSSPQDEPFPVQILSHALSLSPLPVPYLENSSAVLSQATRADTGCCARAAPDSLPHPALTQRQHGRHLMKYFYRGWSVIQLCHSQVDYANALTWDEKQTSRRRTRKMNLMNHELDVLPPYTIWLSSPFSTFPPSRTPPHSLQSLDSSPFTSCLPPFSLWCLLSSSSVTNQDIWHT